MNSVCIFMQSETLATNRLPMIDCDQTGAWLLCSIIRINLECEGGIEKSVLRITNWHHEACKLMTNDDHEGLIFLWLPIEYQ